MAQERLARASQAASLAELSASIAHEVNQPLAAVVANAEACLRWLDRAPPDLAAARQLGGVGLSMTANRASEVVRRVRALANKADMEKVPLDVNDLDRGGYRAGAARDSQPRGLVANGIGAGRRPGSLAIGFNCSR